MAQVAMTVRMDNQLKAQFDTLCEQFGMSANTAINVFVNAVVHTRRIPFDISAPENDSVRKNAVAAWEAIREQAVMCSEPEPTLDEINAEIAEVRSSRSTQKLKR